MAVTLVPQMNLSFITSLESFMWPFIPTVISLEEEEEDGGQ